MRRQLAPGSRIALAAVLAGGLVMGCASEVEGPRVSVDGNELIIEAPEPLSRVRVVDAEGVPVVSRRLPGSSEVLRLTLPPGEQGALSVEVQTTGGLSTVEAVEVLPPAFPVAVRVAAPAGQAMVELEDGGRIEVPVLPGEAVDLAVELEAWRALSVEADLGDGPRELRLRGGEQVDHLGVLDGPTTLTLRAEGATWQAELVPVESSAQSLRESIVVDELVFPATLAGTREIARPTGRVSLPAPWWRGLLRSLGLGVRGRDPTSPWSNQGLVLENRGESDLNVVIEAEVLDGEGELAEPFRAQVRGGQDQSGKVRVLLRVPAGERARAVLPFHVHEGLLDGIDVSENAWTRRISVSPLGSREALHVIEEPLYVSRGSTWASGGLGVALLAALGGTLLLAARGRRWLEERPTSELMTIALFGALSFVVGAVGRLLTMGVAALLGPFATFITNLVDDAFRYTLLATLVTLLPRPGTGALMVLTGWLLSGIALGAFSATDVLFVGSRILWLEGALYLVGLTRTTHWREQAPVLRWLRLAAGFGLASVLTNATGLVLHITLYRLFLADWYVATLLAGPGFLYVVLACAVAVPFADSLRRIQR